MIRLFILAFFGFSSILSGLSDTSIRLRMIQDLETIKHRYEESYAPIEWKKELFALDIEASFEVAKEQILSIPSITLKKYHQIVRDFLRSMRDFHVNAAFFSTEKAELPFDVKGCQGRYFISWVDPFRFPSLSHGIHLGDEILEFDGKPIAEVIETLKFQKREGVNPLTDEAIAALKLTTRRGQAADEVPKGIVNVTIRSSKTGRVMKVELLWDYQPEKITSHLHLFADAIDFSRSTPSNRHLLETQRAFMADPVYQAIALDHSEREGSLGNRKSFLPLFGEFFWTSKEEKALLEEELAPEDDEESADLFFWHTYVYRHPKTKSAIGYIRIPHYVLTQGQIKAYGKWMNFMNKYTDALVIDQLDNFGGFVHAVYQLNSMMTNQPMQAPYHRIKISQKDVALCHADLEKIRKIEELVDRMSKSQTYRLNQNQEDDLSDLLGGENHLNFQQLLFFKKYLHSLIEEWNAGRSLTQPLAIEGVDSINPDPDYSYTKPILMLINEMDLSGGDFMPAILQDNKRATLFGSRTAGAGGFVLSFEFPNTNGIAFCSYTASIAERINADKIENLGVEPDIKHDITPEDIKKGYADYIQAANEALEKLM